MDSARMNEIAAGHERISDKIRALHAAGYQRSEIATFLGRRYQQVRNVIKDDERRAAVRHRSGSHPDTVSTATAAATACEATLTRLGSGGIVEIPATVVERLKIAEGDPLLVTVVGSEIRLLPRAAMITELKRALVAVQPEMMAAFDAIVDEGR